MRKLAILIFIILLALIIGPDPLPFNPADDIVYAIIDLFLSYYIFKKDKTPAEKLD